MDSPNNVITHSSATTWRNCRRRYYYREELAIEPIHYVIAQALWFGSMYHAGLEEWFRTGSQERVAVALHRHFNPTASDYDDDQLIQYSLARLMLQGYVSRWAKQDEEIAFCLPETTFDLPIRNPATGRTSRSFRYRGKLDLPLVTKSGTIRMTEHKTSSQPVGSWMESLWMDAQITGYVGAMQDVGLDVSEAVYDVVQKPTIKRGKAEPVEDYIRRLEELYVGGYNAGKCRRRKAEDDDAYWERRRRESQPVQMYHRETVIIGEHQLNEWRADLWDVSQEILWARQHNRWPRNTSQCKPLGRSLCQYAPLCQSLSGERILIETNYQPRNRHQELVEASEPVF
jgi:hypothetical protein